MAVERKQGPESHEGGTRHIVNRPERDRERPGFTEKLAGKEAAGSTKRNTFR